MSQLGRVGSALLIAMTLLGCQRDQLDDTPPVIAPDAAAIVAGHNARVQGLDRLWARATVQVRGRDAEGNRFREQAEGHLQIVQPGRVALSLGKLGDTLFYLGAGDELYWWLDLSDSDHRVATVGRHSEATPEKTGRLGIPVQPRDLILLLAITPVDESAAVTGWDETGRLAVIETQHGTLTRRLMIDPTTFETLRVELVGADGETITAELEGYDYATVVGDATLSPRVAGRVLVTTPQFDGQLRLSLHGCKNKPISERVFDVVGLMDRFGIEHVVDIDAQASADEPGGQP